MLRRTVAVPSVPVVKETIADWPSTSPITCVSAYFPIVNKHGNKYLEWFKSTLAVNCPYVFFTSKDNVDMIKSFRGSRPTYFVECEIADFYTYKYKDRMATHPRHCPSVDLNLIWNEKLIMIQKAVALNPFNSDWFKWIDAGICVFRNRAPSSAAFNKQDVLQGLPVDKFIYSTSEPYNAAAVGPTHYYHHVSGTYILHRNFVDTFVDTFKEYLERLVDKNNIWTDQVVLTHIYKDKPALFHRMCDGYGVISEMLFG